MRAGWKLDEKPAKAASPLTVAHVLELKTEHVLVWMDDPQVVTALDQHNNRYLGVATDDSDDGELVRWVYVPITHLEFYGLLGCGTTVREALAKDRVIIADRHAVGGVVESMWQVTGDAIPDELRPSEDSFLPETARALLPPPALEDQIVVDGRGVQSDSISFADIGSIVSMFQDLWDALYGSIYLTSKRAVASYSGGESSALMMAGTAPGSFAIKFKPKEERVFDRMFAEYRHLVEASSSESGLKKVLNKLGGNVPRSFASYASFIHDRDLEVLAKSRKASSYVSPRKAARIVNYVAQPKRNVSADEPEAKETTFPVIGYFSGYAYHAKTFEFVRIDDGKMLSGDIEDSVLTRTPIDRGLVLSSETMYKAEIRQTHRADRVAYTLLAFWEVPPGAIKPTSS